MKKTLKKITCSVLAAVSVVGCAATLTACETSHPEVEMKIEFNDKTYTLEYKLYRNIAPATTDHFLWLAGNGYYNGLCVHDYSQSDFVRMYTGAYSVAEEADDADGLVYKKYYETIATYKNYADFPVSVWMEEEKTNPTYTLKGEFSANNFRVENGALKETFGSLTMYYEDISEYEDVAQEDVYMLRADGDGVSKRDYQYNCATSMFYISLSATTKNNSGYCTFATLKEDSESVLKNLQTAINDYIETTYNGESAEFTESESVTVCTDDVHLGDHAITDEFSVPKKPIVIKKVKVLKY